MKMNEMTAIAIIVWKGIIVAIKIEIPLPKTLKESNEDFVIAVDSSGVKIANRGEWIRHKWKLRKGWIKVHIQLMSKQRK